MPGCFVPCGRSQSRTKHFSHGLGLNATQIVIKLRCPCQQCYESHWDPPSIRLTHAKFTGPKKLSFCRSDLEQSKTVRKITGNAPEQRTYSIYNISKAQPQPTTEKKVGVILHCYFYDDTHGMKCLQNTFWSLGFAKVNPKRLTNYALDYLYFCQVDLPNRGETRETEAFG